MPFSHLEVPPMFATAAVDRATDLRHDGPALTAGWETARILRVDPQGRFPANNGHPQLGSARQFGPTPIPGAVFLGVVDQRHLWAIRVPSIDGETTNLRLAAPWLDALDAELVVSAVALLNWHDHAGFSPVDGAPTDPAIAGWSRISRSTGEHEFPRTDPAMICLVHDHADSILLVRQRVWPQSRFSVLAGFLEAGESLEMCVAREIYEEVGIQVRDVGYLGSQPWPFPRSIMIAFSAAADPDEPLQFLDGEIAQGGWFTRDEVRAALRAGDWNSESSRRLMLPGPASISRRMIEAWAKLS